MYRTMYRLPSQLNCFRGERLSSLEDCQGPVQRRCYTAPDISDLGSLILTLSVPNCNRKVSSGLVYRWQQQKEGDIHWGTAVISGTTVPLYPIVDRIPLTIPAGNVAYNLAFRIVSGRPRYELTRNMGLNIASDSWNIPLLFVRRLSTCLSNRATQTSLQMNFMTSSVSSNGCRWAQRRSAKQEPTCIPMFSSRERRGSSSSSTSALFGRFDVKLVVESRGPGAVEAFLEEACVGACVGIRPASSISFSMRLVRAVANAADSRRVEVISMRK